MNDKLRLMIINAFGIVLICAAAGFAQSEKIIVNQIDAVQAQCLKKAHATMPRAKCYSAASDAWQKKVEVTYAALLKKLSPEMKKTLEDGQTAWLKYQEEEENLIGNLYPGRGTGYISVRIIEIMKAYKDRALELESHLQTVKDSAAEN